MKMRRVKKKSTILLACWDECLRVAVGQVPCTHQLGPGGTWKISFEGGCAWAMEASRKSEDLLQDLLMGG